MKTMMLPAAMMAGALVLAGCSIRQADPEDTAAAEDTATPETEAEQTADATVEPAIENPGEVGTTNLSASAKAGEILSGSPVAEPSVDQAKAAGSKAD